MTPRNGGTDKLIADSERLRQRLLAASGRLEAFASELLEEARALKLEAAHSHEGCETDEPRHTAGGNSPAGPGTAPDQHGTGAD